MIEDRRFTPRFICKGDFKIPSSGPRHFKEDYRYTTWDPISGRAPRPGTAQDGIMPAVGFMSQEGKGMFYFRHVKKIT